MSSIERRQEQQQTYWCDECDMSIHLLITSIPSGDYSPICPHCQSHNLELMDGDDPAITTQTILTDTTSITSFFLLDSLFLTLFNDDINSSSSSSSSSLNDLFDTILPTIKITEASLSEGELEDVCAVCKEEFVIEVDDAKILPCNHLFHPHCILPWLTSNHTSCPLCRFHLLLPTTPDDDDDDDDDCSFPDVGTLSNFLPSHF